MKMCWKMIKKVKAVPDTNVIISSIFWRGPPYRVMKHGFEREYIILTSPEIIDEVIDRLKYKFNLPENRIHDLIGILIAFSLVVEPSRRINAVEDDPDDNKIIECAVEGNADYIVSGDKHLLNVEKFEYVEIVTPKEFIELKIQKPPA